MGSFKKLDYCRKVDVPQSGGVGLQAPVKYNSEKGFGTDDDDS